MKYRIRVGYWGVFIPGSCCVIGVGKSGMTFGVTRTKPSSISSFLLISSSLLFFTLSLREHVPFRFLCILTLRYVCIIRHDMEDKLVSSR